MCVSEMWATRLSEISLKMCYVLQIIHVSCKEPVGTFWMALIWNSWRNPRRMRDLAVDALSNESRSFPATRKDQQRYQLSCRSCLHATVLLSYRSGIVKANTKFPSLFHLNFPLLPPFFPVKARVCVFGGKGGSRFPYYSRRFFIASLALTTCKEIPLL